MDKEELKKELEKLKDFKVYVFEGEIYVKAEYYKEMAIENKTLKDNVEFLHSCLDDRDKSIAIMQEENKKLKEENEELQEYKGMYEGLG